MTDQPSVILCVDDDPDILVFLTTVLEAEGCRVVTARSAEEGLRSWIEHQPDLVIVDLMMEEVDAGTNLVKDLRLAGNEAPIFLLSNAGDDLAGTAAPGQLGLAGILQKPLTSQRLVRLLKNRLG